MLGMRSQSTVLWKIPSFTWKMTNNLAWLVVLMLSGILCRTAGQKWPLLFLGNVLRETAGQIQLLGFSYSSYEVTIPRKLMPRHGQQRPEEVSYLLKIEGKGQVVHLRQKKDFVPKHFPVFTYSKKGDLEVNYPFIKDDCFYHGFVQDQNFSVVALSTCTGGLRGLLSFRNKTYEIEPVMASTTFQHVVYHLEGKEGATHMWCGLTEEEQRHQESLIQNMENIMAKNAFGREWWTHTRYVKLAIVVDYEGYVKYDRNETLVIIQVLNVIHITNSFYEPLSVQLSVAGLEIWSEGNLINITKSIAATLESFTIWRRDTLLNRLENDAGHLFAYMYFGKEAGLAYVGQVCSKRWGTAVESFITSSLFSFSVTFAHELGHNLGMIHDAKFCHCGRKSCIMAPYHSHTDKFSNCSYKQYFAKRNSPCLLIPPDPDKMYKLKYCGNKIVENGEQCDCGTKVQCKMDPCCQSNCKLRPGAVCNIGLCCAKCQYHPAGTICREKTGHCDLAEYCNGNSEWCPEDVYVQDGAPCSDGVHCYHGKCATDNEQCKMIFGKKATVASEICFRIMNAQGDRFGNCGLKHGTYSKCRAQDILCGRIQCENVHNIPSLEEHNTVVQTAIGDKQCWGTDYHSGMEIADIGAVRDGTPCGTDMMCIDRQCIRVSLLKYDCDVTKCHNRGICNTHKHCHCDYGWTPPHCVKEGYGGSIDSGPPPPPPRKENTIVGALVGSLFLLFAAGLCFCVYCRHKLMLCLRRLGASTPVNQKNNSKEDHII